MLKVEIKSDTITPRIVNIKNGLKAGQQTTFHEQEAYITLADNDGNPRPYPMLTTLNIDVEHGQKPYPPGVYVVDDRSFYLDRFRQLAVGKLSLRSLPAQSVQKAA
jgi:hypothetical protein